MDNKEIINKIKRLLALGDKTKNSSEAEAESAMLKAHELMAKYDISVELSAEEEIVYSEQFCETKWNMAFRKPLATIIAKNFRCETYLSGRSGPIVFFGHESDVTIAKNVFEFAYSFAMSQGNKQYNKNYQLGKITKGVFNSYVTGFISGLQKKLGEQSKELMVITPPDVTEKFKEMSANFKTASHGMRATGFDAEAYIKGQEDGRSVLARREIQA